MADGTADRPRYQAFISYSHRDAAFGRRLHRRLEGYAVPRRLIGKAGAFGPVPGRLMPIFRDREELSAAGDLSAEVKAALAASKVLVVVCSPSAAASPWVGREIEIFRALHPDRPVLAAVVAGEPADCFHEAMRLGGVEPLAADFRREGDGPRLALLKLAAGIAGVGLDELIQRDAQRQMTRVTAVTAGALTLTLVMAAMTAVALDARAEAERQRAEAEGLVEFMLTDLRNGLKGEVPLRVLGVVNKKALDYYAGQDLKRLSPASLERRVRVLQAMGEDDNKRGKQKEALSRFLEARRTTAAQLADDPNNPDRIFAHSQSEFWVALMDYQLGRKDKAVTGFNAYRELMGRLVKIAPGDIKYQEEFANAEAALCSAALIRPVDPALTLRHCGEALALAERYATTTGRTPAAMAAVADQQAWLADAYEAAGNPEQAKRLRLSQEAIIDSLIAANPESIDLKDQWIGVQRALARLERAAGDIKASRGRLLRAREVVAGMTAIDAENAIWRWQVSEINSELSDSERRVPGDVD